VVKLPLPTPPEPDLKEVLHVLAFATWPMGLGITNITPTAIISAITRLILFTIYPIYGKYI